MRTAEARFIPVLVPAAAAGALWVLAGAGNTWILRWGQGHIPASFAGLVFPPTLSQAALQFLPVSALVVVSLLAALAVAAFAAVLLPVATRAEGARRRGPVFLAAWACMVLASVAGSGVLAAAELLANWPPARIAWAIEAFVPSLLNGAYWGVAWGWLPALLAALLAAPALASPPAAHPGQVRWLPAALFAASAVALLAVLPSITPAPQDYTAEPEPQPTEEPVVYGAQKVGPSLTAADPAWCTGEEVRMEVGGWDAATGHRGARVTVLNIGARTCVVQGYPDLAFENTEGWVMDILPVHGGSFMTDDVSQGPVTVAPGQAAAASIGWNGTAGAGAVRVGTLLVAPFAGTLRQDLAANIDLVEPGYLTVTGWAPYDEAAQD